MRARRWQARKLLRRTDMDTDGTHQVVSLYFLRPGRWRRRHSDRVLVGKYTVRRLGFERSQPRIEAEPRPAVRTEDHVSIAHIDVNVRVVLRRGRPDAFEFTHADDVDFRDAAVVPELQIAAVSLV